MATPYQERKYRDPSLNPGDAPYFEEIGRAHV